MDLFQGLGVTAPGKRVSLGPVVMVVVIPLGNFMAFVCAGLGRAAGQVCQGLGHPVHLGPRALTADEIRGTESRHPFWPVSDPLPFRYSVSHSTRSPSRSVAERRFLSPAQHLPSPLPPQIPLSGGSREVLV